MKHFCDRRETVCRTGGIRDDDIFFCHRFIVYAQNDRGVDLVLGNQVKAGLSSLLKAASRPEVLGKVGGFGGLFALQAKKFRQPVLVSSVDGVGTKLKVAFKMNRHDTIGQDLVNHCVDDIAVLGAEPLFFLDYLGTGVLKPHVFEEIISGFAKGCSENNCALIGGETAQMPGFYQKGEYDVSGTIVGVVEKSKMLNGHGIKPGDAVIGIASSGLHTNGYSLARRVFFDIMKLGPETAGVFIADVMGHTSGQVSHRLHSLAVLQSPLDVPGILDTKHHVIELPRHETKFRVIALSQSYRELTLSDLAHPFDHLRDRLHQPGSEHPGEHQADQKHGNGGGQVVVTRLIDQLLKPVEMGLELDSPEHDIVGIPLHGF